MNLKVTSDISSVNIFEDTRINHGMIQRGIEYGLVVIRASLDLYPAKFGIPAVPCISSCLVECSAGRFCTIIPVCTFNINKRDTYLHGHFFAFLCREICKEADMTAFEFIFTTYYFSFCNPCKISVTDYIILMS